MICNLLSTLNSSRYSKEKPPTITHRLTHFPHLQLLHLNFILNFSFLNSENSCCSLSMCFQITGVFFSQLKIISRSTDFRYKLCASLPNYLEKENLDELESCKFPYGINNNNNNNNELEFYDLKKDLELNLKPILIKSRTEDYVTNDQGYGSERSPEEEYPPDILNQKNLQDCGGEESSKASDQQICQVHPFINQSKSGYQMIFSGKLSQFLLYLLYC